MIKVEGDIVIPIDLRNIGMWLKALLGSPVSLGDTAHTHTFVSGNSGLPSLSLETGLPDIPAYFLASGVMANSLQVKFARSGAADATLGLIAQGEVKRNASADVTPTTLPITRFNQFQGSIKKNGQALGNVVAAQLTYSNNLARIETIRSDGKIEGADPTVASLTGNLEVRFADTELIDAATNNTPLELTFSYVIDATKSLTFIAHEVYLPKPKLSISGPGGTRSVGLQHFDGAHRFHTGGLVAGEVPIIAQPGEAVFTQGQLRALGGALAKNNPSPVKVLVNVTNHAPGVDARVQTTQQPDGSTRLDVIVEQIEARMNRSINQGVGIAPTLERRYGLNPAVGALR